MTDCTRCEGKGEIPLMGAKTADCPDCSGRGFLGPTIVWSTGAAAGREVTTKGGSTFFDVTEVVLEPRTARCLVRRARRSNTSEDHDSVIGVIAYYSGCESLFSKGVASGN